MADQGWVPSVFLPDDRYRVREVDSGWEVLTWDEETAQRHAADDGYVRLYDYHVDGCTFTLDDGWQCLPGCPSLEVS